MTSMNSIVGFLVAVAMVPTVAAEQSWELRAEFGSLKSGDPEIAILRLPDGRSIEVPIAALSPASQAAIRRAVSAAAPAPAPTDSGGDKVVTVRGPFGRSVRVPVPESIKDIECDAIHCRSAADAADVYRLALAGDRLTGEPRKAAEVRFREWAVMADKGLVRLGDRWVSPDEAGAAADEAEKLLRHAFELMRIGNAKQAGTELQKARRTDPECVKAIFVIGLAYAFVEKDLVKAAEQFADVVRLEPDNTAALNNLAVAEMQIPRYAPAVEHFRDAVQRASDPRPVVDNIAVAVKRGGDAATKMPAKVVEDLNTLYRLLLQDMKLKPSEGVTELKFLGPNNAPCTAGNPADIARFFDTSSSGPPVAMRRSLGFVVAPGHVVCPRQAVVGRDGTTLGEVAVELPGDRGQRIAAVLVAAPADGDVALLKCDGLSLEPLPLAAAMPSPPDISAVDLAGSPRIDKTLKAARGTALIPALEIQSRRRLFHTAVVPRGPGGGPIVDAGGRVTGMVAATPRTDTSGNTAGFGLPAEQIMAVISEHLPDLPRVEPGKDDMDAAERRALERTVLVVVSANPPGEHAQGWAR